MLAQADALCMEKRFEDAASIYQHLVGMAEGRLGPNHPDTVLVVQRLADALYQMNAFRDCLPLYERLCQMARGMLGDADPDVINLIFKVGRTQELIGSYVESRATYEFALANARKHLPPNHELSGQIQGRYEILLERIEENKKAAQNWKENTRNNPVINVPQPSGPVEKAPPPPLPAMPNYPGMPQVASAPELPPSMIPASMPSAPPVAAMTAPSMPPAPAMPAMPSMAQIPGMQAPAKSALPPHMMLPSVDEDILGGLENTPWDDMKPAGVPQMQPSMQQMQPQMQQMQPQMTAQMSPQIAPSEPPRSPFDLSQNSSSPQQGASRFDISGVQPGRVDGPPPSNVPPPFGGPATMSNPFADAPPPDGAGNGAPPQSAPQAMADPFNRGSGNHPPGSPFGNNGAAHPPGSPFGTNGAQDPGISTVGAQLLNELGLFDAPHAPPSGGPGMPPNAMPAPANGAMASAPARTSPPLTPPPGYTPPPPGLAPPPGYTPLPTSANQFGTASSVSTPSLASQALPPAQSAPPAFSAPPAQLAAQISPAPQAPLAPPAPPAPVSTPAQPFSSSPELPGFTSPTNAPQGFSSQPNMSAQPLGQPTAPMPSGQFSSGQPGQFRQSSQFGQSTEPMNQPGQPGRPVTPVPPSPGMQPSFPRSGSNEFQRGGGEFPRGGNNEFRPFDSPQSEPRPFEGRSDGPPPFPDASSPALNQPEFRGSSVGGLQSSVGATLAGNPPATDPFSESGRKNKPDPYLDHLAQKVAGLKAQAQGIEPEPAPMPSAFRPSNSASDSGWHEGVTLPVSEKQFDTGRRKAPPIAYEQPIEYTDMGEESGYHSETTKDAPVKKVKTARAAASKSEDFVSNVRAFKEYLIPVVVLIVVFIGGYLFVTLTASKTPPPAAGQALTGPGQAQANAEVFSSPDTSMRLALGTTRCTVVDGKTAITVPYVYYDGTWSTIAMQAVDSLMEKQIWFNHVPEGMVTDSGTILFDRKAPDFLVVDKMAKFASAASAFAAAGNGYPTKASQLQSQAYMYGNPFTGQSAFLKLQILPESRGNRQEIISMLQGGSLLLGEDKYTRGEVRGYSIVDATGGTEKGVAFFVRGADRNGNFFRIRDGGQVVTLGAMGGKDLSNCKITGASGPATAAIPPEKPTKVWIAKNQQLPIFVLYHSLPISMAVLAFLCFWRSLMVAPGQEADNATNRGFRMFSFIAIGICLLSAVLQYSHWM